MARSEESTRRQSFEYAAANSVRMPRFAWPRRRAFVFSWPTTQSSEVLLISYAPPKNPTKPGQNLTWGQGLRGSGAPGAQSLRDTPALDGDGVDAPRGQRVRGLGATRPPHPPRDAALRPAGGRATGKCPAAPARERKTPAGSLRLRLASSAILLRRLEKPRTLRRRRASRSRGRVPPMRAEGE